MVSTRVTFLGHASAMDPLQGGPSWICPERGQDTPTPIRLDQEVRPPVRSKSAAAHRHSSPETRLVLWCGLSQVRMANFKAFGLCYVVLCCTSNRLIEIGVEAQKLYQTLCSLADLNFEQIRSKALSIQVAGNPPILAKTSTRPSAGPRLSCSPDVGAHRGGQPPPPGPRLSGGRQVPERLVSWLDVAHLLALLPVGFLDVHPFVLFARVLKDACAGGYLKDQFQCRFGTCPGLRVWPGSQT